MIRSIKSTKLIPGKIYLDIQTSNLRFKYLGTGKDKSGRIENYFKCVTGVLSGYLENEGIIALPHARSDWYYDDTVHDNKFKFVGELK